MDSPQTLADALSALSAAKSDLVAFNELTAEHNASLEAFAKLKQDNAALQLAYETLAAEKAILSVEMEAAKAAEVNANAKAVEIVASIGVEPVAFVPEEASVTRKSLAERLEGVTDSRERGRIRTEFLNQINNP
jgi:seryl-tRNA synthetase